MRKCQSRNFSKISLSNLKIHLIFTLEYKNHKVFWIKKSWFKNASMKYKKKITKILVSKVKTEINKLLKYFRMSRSFLWALLNMRKTLQKKRPSFKKSTSQYFLNFTWINKRTLIRKTKNLILIAVKILVSVTLSAIFSTKIKKGWINNQTFNLVNIINLGCLLNYR